MKKILLTLFVVLSVACTDRVTEIESMEVPVTRTMIDEVSSTNPNLITDWENLNDIVLWNGIREPTPWAISSPIVSNVDFAMDVKKEDGWIMLCHTFKALNAYENINYIMLYNKLTGFLKVFYYNKIANSSPNGALWHIKCQSGIGSSFFNLNNYFALPDNAASKNTFVTLSNALDEPSNGFQLGWNGFEMELPYTTDYAKMLFSISTYNKAITSYTFSGTTENKIEGTIVKTMPSTSSILKSISTLSGQGAKGLIGKFKKKVDEGSDATVKAKLGTKIINALSKISTEGYTSAFLGGLKLIFGSSTVTEKEQVHLTSNGTVNLEGTSINISTGAAYPIGNLNWYDMTGLNNSVNGSQYLGVWTLSDTPTVRFTRYSTIKNAKKYWTSGTLYSPMGGNITANVKINPDLEPYITSRSITTELVYCEKFDGKSNSSYPFGCFGNNEIYSDDSMKLVETLKGTESISASILCSGMRVPDGYELFYDWGAEPKDNFVVVVTVKLSYNYNGKSHTIVSSRPYKAKYIVDESYNGNHIRPNSKVYIVNTGEYLFEDRRDPVYEY